MSTARWQQWAVNAVLVLSAGVLVAVLYLGFRQDRQGAVLDRVDAVTASQQESADSTRCAREVTSDGEIAQLEALDVLAAAFTDLVPDNQVDQRTVDEVFALRSQLEAAQAGYGSINEVCPVPDGVPFSGDPNDPED